MTIYNEYLNRILTKPWPNYRTWQFIELREDSIDHLWRAWHVSRGRLIFRSPAPVQFWTCICSTYACAYQTFGDIDFAHYQILSYQTFIRVIGLVRHKIPSLYNHISDFQSYRPCSLSHSFIIPSHIRLSELSTLFTIRFLHYAFTYQTFRVIDLVHYQIPSLCLHISDFQS